MKLIPFFPDDPVDTGIFCKCVRYLVAAYFRILPAFEIFFIRGIKHDFPFINIRKVPREDLKTEGEARGFQLPEGPCEC